MVKKIHSENNQSDFSNRLPSDMKNEIYHFLSPEDLVRLKRVAKLVKDTVKGYEAKLSEKIAARLKNTRINARNNENNKEQKSKEREQYLTNLSSAEACLIFAKKKLYNALSDEEKVLVGYRHHKTLAVILQNDNLLKLYNKKTKLLYGISVILPLHPWFLHIFQANPFYSLSIDLSEKSNNRTALTSSLLKEFCSIAPDTLGKAIFKNWNLFKYFNYYQLKSMADSDPNYFCEQMINNRILLSPELLCDLTDTYSSDSPLGKWALSTILNKSNHSPSNNSYVQAIFNKPALAYRIINNKEFARKLPREHRKREKPGLLGQIAGMLAGILIATVSGTFTSLFTLPIASIIPFAKGLFSELWPGNHLKKLGIILTLFPIAVYFIAIALSLYLAIGLLCRILGFFYDLVRGACFGWTEGIKEVIYLPQTMIQETLDTKRNSNGKFGWLLAYGIVSPENWHVTDYNAQNIATKAAEYEKQLLAQASQQNMESINIESNPDLITASTADNSQSSAQYGKLFLPESKKLPQSECTEFYVPSARVFMR